MKFPIRDIQELLAACMLGLRIYHVIDLQRLGSGSFRIAEHVKLAYIQTAYELACLLEVLVCFATGSNNYVYTDKSMRHYFLDLFDLMTEKSGVVTAAH